MTDRLSPLDASFLTRETQTTPMHLGGLGIFEPGLEFTDVAETLRVRLGDIPAARKRLQSVPFGIASPVLVDDGDFDLSYHLRHSALPAPGDTAQLTEFLARLIARPLDRHRPLWELYVIEGLEGGRVALFRKLHLAVASGDAGDPFSVLLDSAPEHGEVGVHTRPARWEPEPAPHRVSLAAGAVQQRLERVAELGKGSAEFMWSSARDPQKAVGAAAGAAETAVGIAWRAVRRPPKSPLNRQLTSHRRFAMSRLDLQDLRRIRQAFSGTINDVIVTVAADAIGRFLRWRGYETKDLDLRVMVPVRVVDGEPESVERGIAETATPGGEVVGVLAPLPVMEMDAVARLYRVMGELAGLKESRQAVAADSLVRLAGYAPANLHAMAARLVSGEERYNAALSNAPGPQTPRWLAGVRMQETYPFIPVTGDAALSIAVSSYDGVFYFGLLGDRSALGDLDTLAGFVPEAAAELLAAAEAVEV
jgi:WS/DGAT/MGAT family acyltransferase